MTERHPHVVIGAGPAGLAAAHTFAKAGEPVVVIEQSDQVGGLSASFRSHGCILDYGPHFFSPEKAEAIDLWNAVLADQQIHYVSTARMYWNDKWFGYPPGPIECVKKLGPIQGVRILAALLRRRLMPLRAESYADNARNAYGDLLFSGCFSRYIEKLFGVPCEQISADWKPGRLRDTSLMQILWAIVAPKKDLVLPHPRLGTGQFYERLAEETELSGGSIHTRHKVTRIDHDGSRITDVWFEDVRTKTMHRVAVEKSVISSVPLPMLHRLLEPTLPSTSLATRPKLRFRSAILVYLFVQRSSLFREQCCYIMDPEIPMGRVTNFANWSPEMAPDPNLTPLCCEYWCDLGDPIWEMPETEIRDQAIGDLRRISVLNATDTLAGFEIRRMPRTHPVPLWKSEDTSDQYATQLSNLHLIGRGGSFSYIDQDDTLIMGIRAARAAQGLAEGEST